MVVAKILSVLLSSNQHQVNDAISAVGGTKFNSKIVAIHIDYANREESGREAAFLQDWCERNKIEFHKRVINEATRGITERNQYEIITREIRYNFYLTIMKLINENFSDEFHLYGVHHHYYYLVWEKFL